MTREQEIILEIENLPTGNLKRDALLIENKMVQTLNLCRELFISETLWDDKFGDILDLIDSVLDKWEEINSFDLQAPSLLK